MSLYYIWRAGAQEGPYSAIALVALERAAEIGEGTPARPAEPQDGAWQVYADLRPTVEAEVRTAAPPVAVGKPPGPSLPDISKLSLIGLCPGLAAPPAGDDAIDGPATLAPHARSAVGPNYWTWWRIALGIGAAGLATALLICLWLGATASWPRLDTRPENREAQYQRFRQEGWLAFQAEITNAVIGYTRTIGSRVDDADPNPWRWTAMATVEFVNSRGGIERTNVPFCFRQRAFFGPDNHPHVTCCVDEERLLQARIQALRARWSRQPAP